MASYAAGEASPAAYLEAATAPPSWQVASYFTRDWSVTFNTTAPWRRCSARCAQELRPGGSYVLCMDYNGASGLHVHGRRLAAATTGFAKAYDGVLKMNPVVAEFAAGGAQMSPKGLL